MIDHAGEARAILRDLWAPMEATGAPMSAPTMQNRIAEATAHALLAIADALTTTQRPLICPSRQSRFTNSQECMLPLGHTTKHESPERQTW